MLDYPEKCAGDKHSSVLCLAVIDAAKKFCNIDTKPFSGSSSFYEGLAQKTSNDYRTLDNKNFHNSKIDT